MAKDEVVRGSTSQMFDVFIQNAGATNGSGLTGLTQASAGLTCYYHIDNAAAATAMTLVTATVGTFTANGFKEVDATNQPGVYQLMPPNAAFSNTTSRRVIFYLKGATNMAPAVFEIALKAIDTNNATTSGIGALPNATPGNAAGGLLILGTNNQAISFTAGMTVSNAGGDALTISSGGSNGNGINASGNGSGAGIKATGGATGHGISAVGGATSGDGLSAAAATSGHGITATGVGTTKHGVNATGGSTTSHGISATGGGVGHGILATSGGGATGDGIKAVGASTDGNGLNLVGVGTGNGLLATGGAGAAGDGIEAVAGGGVPIRGNITGNVTGNLSGSVGSVTGAVGSVTARVTANADQWAGGTIPAPNVTGVPLVDLKYIFGTILAEAGAGRLAAAFNKLFDVAVPVLTAASVNQTGDSFARLGAPAGASVSADIASIKTDTGTTIPNLIAALNNLSAAQVNSEVVDCLNVDTYAQPGQGTPAATTTITLMLRFLFKAWRNKSAQSATEYDLYNDDASTVDQKATFADDGTVATRGEVATGP